MSNCAEVVPLFVDLCYKEMLPTIAARNDEMRAKALLVREQVDRTVAWRCDTFATLGSAYNVLDDALFGDLVAIAQGKVLEFATVYGVQEGACATCHNAWLNVAAPNDFQEVHTHPMSHFSAVYYVHATEKCGDLIFTSPAATADMFPLPASIETNANRKLFSVTPTSGMLLVFRSNMPHMVAKNQSGGDRISVAMNFVLATSQTRNA